MEQTTLHKEFIHTLQNGLEKWRMDCSSNQWVKFSNPCQVEKLESSGVTIVMFINKIFLSLSCLEFVEVLKDIDSCLSSNLEHSLMFLFAGTPFYFQPMCFLIQSDNLWLLNECFVCSHLMWLLIWLDCLMSFLFLCSSFMPSFVLNILCTVLFLFVNSFYYII